MHIGTNKALTKCFLVLPSRSFNRCYCGRYGCYFKEQLANLSLYRCANILRSMHRGHSGHLFHSSVAGEENLPSLPHSNVNEGLRKGLWSITNPSGQANSSLLPTGTKGELPGGKRKAILAKKTWFKNIMAPEKPTRFQLSHEYCIEVPSGCAVFHFQVGQMVRNAKVT